MPELPEVETLRRSLARGLTGRRIVGVRVLIPKMIKGPVADPAEFTRLLRESRIESVERRGKHLIFTLHSGYYLLLHLKMRGGLLLVPRGLPDEKYLAVALQIEDGVDLRFHDMWTWGEMRLLTADALARHPSLSEMGPEPLSEAWTPQEFRRALQKRPRAAIKAALLDQRIVAGIGNIYADESLFRSGIRSLRPAASLSDDEIVRLQRAVQSILTEAIAGGGALSDSYTDADARAGRFEPSVYDRAGKPCVRCGAALQRIKVGGRGTVYCPVCQS
jgi:formamidopyrimidine-DNA glycosylase